MGVKRRSRRRAIAMTDAAGRLRCRADPINRNRREDRKEEHAEDKTLRDVPVGQSATVRRLVGEGAIKRRIMDMGITKGTDIYVRKVAPLGDPIE